MSALIPFELSALFVTPLEAAVFFADDNVYEEQECVLMTIAASPEMITSYAASIPSPAE